VIVAGDSWTETYADRNGDRRTKRVIRAQYLGASLRFANIVTTRTHTDHNES
jgi:single-stranded DNA-binding protein